jgi:hypothetical protein
MIGPTVVALSRANHDAALAAIVADRPAFGVSTDGSTVAAGVRGSAVPDGATACARP